MPAAYGFLQVSRCLVGNLGAVARGPGQGCDRFFLGQPRARRGAGGEDAWHPERDHHAVRCAAHQDREHPRLWRRGRALRPSQGGSRCDRRAAIRGAGADADQAVRRTAGDRRPRHDRARNRRTGERRGHREGRRAGADGWRRFHFRRRARPERQGARSCRAPLRAARLSTT